MCENVKADLRRYIATEEIEGLRSMLFMFCFNWSFHVIVSYRFGRWVREEFRIPVLQQILKVISRLTHEGLGLLTGIQIPFEATIGPGLYIGHIGMLVVNRQTQIGSNCNLSLGVVIGQGGRGEKKGAPVIGNNVYIGAGAKVIGKITIGDGVAIGANAVVTKDIPPNCTVGGVPARVLNNEGSKDFIR